MRRLWQITAEMLIAFGHRVNECRKYDYRYSQLTHVFGRLLYEKRLPEQELRGLRKDKLKPNRFFRQILGRGRGLIYILSAIA